MTATHRPFSLTGHDPDGYERHLLHRPDRSYAETNCYMDVVVELLHACGYEPLALLSNVVRMDFEGDQWTFFKPPPEDLEALFGIDIHEMNPYRPLPVQIEEQLALGRTMIVELDAWYLPDTASTSYRSEHVKTSVAIESIDRQGERLRYFHGPGLFELSGEDYRGAFRIGHVAPEVLPPYTELVRFDAGPRPAGDELRAVALGALRRHLDRRPSSNPVARFGAALEAALPQLVEADLPAFHGYAFATVRLLGSGFEALGDHVRWLLGERGEAAGAACAEIVETSKALSFRLARRRAFDSRPMIERMGDAWDRVIGELERATA